MNKKSFIDRFNEQTQRSSNIMIKGAFKVVIESFKKVLECNESLVIILTVDSKAEIWGRNLKLTSYSSGYAEVTGDIERVEFNSVKRKKEA